MIKQYNIIDIVPSLDLSDPRTRDMRIESVKEFFSEFNKPSCSRDEMCFMLLLEDYINAFQKAKTMIARGRFSVRYTNYKGDKAPDILDFSIIPLLNPSEQSERN